MNALIVFSDGFEEIETLAVADILRRGGISVILATLSAELAPVTGARGVKVLPDATLDQCPGADYKVLILPGGWQNAQNLAKSQLLAQFLQVRAKKGELIAAICASPAVVLGASQLPGEGLPVTCYPGLEQQLVGDYVDRAVVECDGFITSQGPATAIPFALAILGRLAGKETAEAVSQDLLYRGV